MSKVTQQIADVLSSSTKVLATPYELAFNPNPAIEFASNNWPLAFGLVAGYLLFIFGVQHIMKDRKPFDLRLPLAAWNALLCIFSFIGMARTV